MPPRCGPGGWDRSGEAPAASAAPPGTSWLRASGTGAFGENCGKRTTAGPPMKQPHAPSRPSRPRCGRAGPAEEERTQSPAVTRVRVPVPIPCPDPGPRHPPGRSPPGRTWAARAAHPEAAAPEHREVPAPAETAGPGPAPAPPPAAAGGTELRNVSRQRVLGAMAPWPVSGIAWPEGAGKGSSDPVYSFVLFIKEGH